jgi:hypothetical protein
MSQPQPPKIQMSNLPEYREGYANSVQIRVNLWDFFLLFGLVNQTAPDNVNIQNFQGHLPEPAAGQGVAQRPPAKRQPIRNRVRRDQARAAPARRDRPVIAEPARRRRIPSRNLPVLPGPVCFALFSFRTRRCCACPTTGMNSASSYPPRWISFTAASGAPGFRIPPFPTYIRPA